MLYMALGFFVICHRLISYAADVPYVISLEVRFCRVLS